MREATTMPERAGIPTTGGPSTRRWPAVFIVAIIVLGFSARVSAQPSPSAPAADPLPTPASSPAPSAPSSPVDDARSGPPAWEYRTLFVTWDSSVLDWVADFSDGTRIQGLDPILNNEGQHGWELVAVVPELWTQIVEDAIRNDARRLRIFLKKPLD